MDERSVDIKMHTDMLQQQVKHATTEKAKIRFFFFSFSVSLVSLVSQFL